MSNGASETKFVQELILYAASAALSCLVLFMGLKHLDPNREASKKALEQRKEMEKRLGRPFVQTNPYEVTIYLFYVALRFSLTFNWGHTQNFFLWYLSFLVDSLCWWMLGASIWLDACLLLIPCDEKLCGIFCLVLVYIVSFCALTTLVMSVNTTITTKVKKLFITCNKIIRGDTHPSLITGRSIVWAKTLSFTHRPPR